MTGEPKKGAVAWCKRCSRRHGRREPCAQFLRTKETKSGKTTKRWAA